MMSSHVTRRRLLLPLLGVAVAHKLVRPGTIYARQDAAADAETEVFFGWLLGIPDIAAVALDVSAPDDGGLREVRAYVCDGLGPPDGMAVWFKDTVDEEVINQLGGSASLTAPGDQGTLTLTHLDALSVDGFFTASGGQVAKFSATPAVNGAGIYDVTLNEALEYQGVSTDGSTLVAQADPEGRVTGTITTPEGEEIAFNVQSLALASTAVLAESGLPPTYLEFAANSLIPGAYVAVIAPAGRFWLGRDGSVRDGKGGKNIIDLDAHD